MSTVYQYCFVQTEIVILPSSYSIHTGFQCIRFPLGSFIVYGDFSIWYGNYRFDSVASENMNSCSKIDFNEILRESYSKKVNL